MACTSGPVPTTLVLESLDTTGSDSRQEVDHSMGSEKLPQEVLSEMAERAQSIYHVKVKLFGKATIYGLRISVLKIRQLRASSQIPLPYLLEISQGHHSSDPRDKIFALWAS